MKKILLNHYFLAHLCLEQQILTSEVAILDVEQIVKESEAMRDIQNTKVNKNRKVSKRS